MFVVVTLFRRSDRPAARSTEKKRGILVQQIAGWIGVGMGVTHIVVAPMGWRDLWSRVAADGVWNTFTLEPESDEQHRRAEALWTTIGSFGVPVLAFGSYVVWSTRDRRRVPGWLGWLFVGWGVPFAIVLPASPAWAFPLMGGLLVLGDRTSRPSS